MKLLIVLVIIIQVFSTFAAGYVEFSADLNSSQAAAKRVEREINLVYEYAEDVKRITCEQPKESSDISYTAWYSNNDELPNRLLRVTENGTMLSYCNVGYAFDYEHEGYYEVRSYCKNGSWQPPVLKCKGICHHFTNFVRFNMTCHQYVGGPKIPCSGLLLEGAIAKPRCQKKYRPDKIVDYEYATCQANGTWDKDFFKCVPECGAVAPTAAAVNLIAYGEPEMRGGAPWNLAIYSAERNPQSPQFICGGTLISDELVISAAHCFYNEVFHLKPDIGFFYGIVAKLNSDFHEKNLTTTKTYKFRNIYYPDEVTFEGADTSYAGDIVILRLSENVTFSTDVFPACLDWDKRDRFNPGENVKGKLSGFGEFANGTLPSVLLTANLPFISYGVCKEKVREDFRRLISTDKFCAGSVNGSGARKGDSGGGLLYMDDASGLYHLRGVVSNKDLSESSTIATFTDIAQYMTWIIKIKEAIADEYKLCKCNPDGSLSNSCDSKTGTCHCKVFVTGKNCDTCKDGYWKLTADNPNGCVDCGCSSMGSYSSICDKTDGSCQCKPGVFRRRCDECADNFQVLGSNGCEDGPKWVKFAHGEKCSNAVVGGFEIETNETSVVVRHQIEKSIIPGKLVPTRRVARIVFLSKFNVGSPIPLLSGHQFSEYEVLCGGLVEWVVPYEEKVPPGAVVGGTFVFQNSTYTSAHSEDVYVCRASVKDNVFFPNDKSLTPGQLIFSQGFICHIHYGSYALSRSLFEVLVQHNTTACECDPIGSYSPTCEGRNKTCKCKPNVIGKNCDRCALDTYKFGSGECKGPKWLEYSDGNKCSNAVVAGKLKSSNESILITRWKDKVDGGKVVFPGILNNSSQKMLLSWSGHVPLKYEVLCGDSTKWVTKRDDLFPSQPLVRFQENVDSLFARQIKYMYYVCRGKTPDGFAPGMLRELHCVVSFKDKVYRLEEYEVLQVE